MDPSARNRRTDRCEAVVLISDEESDTMTTASTLHNKTKSNKTNSQVNSEQNNNTMHTNANQEFFENCTGQNLCQHGICSNIEKLIDQKVEEKFKQLMQMYKEFIPKNDLKHAFEQQKQGSSGNSPTKRHGQYASNVDRKRKKCHDDRANDVRSDSSNARAKSKQHAIQIEKYQETVQKSGTKEKLISSPSKAESDSHHLRSVATHRQRSIVTSESDSNGTTENGKNCFVVPKNTDMSFYLNEGDTKTCPICDKSFKRMVYHFKVVHPNCEVYISRISPQMVKSAENLKGNSIAYTKKGATYIQALCLFCGVRKDFMSHYWVDHLRSHTGEYGNKCGVCKKRVSFYTHCSAPTQRERKALNLSKEDVYAYMCTICNFTQIYKKRMREHLKVQHEIDTKNYEKFYRKILLMPSLKEIPFVTDPNNKGQNASKPNDLLVNGSSSFQKIQYKPSINGVKILDIQIIRPPNGTMPRRQSMIEEAQSLCESAMSLLVPMSSNGTNNQQINTISTSYNTETPSSMNWYKIDADEERNLLNIHNNYDQITSAFKVSVRPWIDGDYAKKPKINILTQLALYKCMHEQCLFSTNDVKHWKRHMLKHLELFDVLKKEGMLSKLVRNRHIAFRECPYCGYLAKTNYDFLAHIDLNHRFCAFQCFHCFYRCNELDNIVLHYEKFHKNKFRDVLLCSEHREMEDKDFEQIEHYCGQNIRKFVCGQVGCKDEFACWNNFHAHICEYHANGYKCPHCHQTIDTRQAIYIKNHLAKHTKEYEAHEMDEFQCIFCNNSQKNRFYNVNDIKEHMLLMHPSYFLFVGARQCVNTEQDDGDIQIIYVGNMCNYEEYHLYKCTNPNILNCFKPDELNAHRQLEEQKNYSPTMKRFYGSLPIEINENLSFVTYEKYQQSKQPDLYC